MPARQHPELRPDANVREFNHRKHHVGSTRRPPVVGADLIFQNLDEAPLRSDQRSVSEIEGMERDARGREKGKHGISRIMQQRVSEKAAGGGGEGRGISLSGFGRDDPVGEDAGERRVVFSGGVGMDVDVEKIRRDVFEEQFPERSERERGIGEKHEGQFPSWRWGRVDTGGKREKQVVILGRRRRRGRRRREWEEGNCAVIVGDVERVEGEKERVIGINGGGAVEGKDNG